MLAITSTTRDAADAVQATIDSMWDVVGTVQAITGTTQATTVVARNDADSMQDTSCVTQAITSSARTVADSALTIEGNMQKKQAL